MVPSGVTQKDVEKSIGSRHLCNSILTQRTPGTGEASDPIGPKYGEYNIK